MNRRTPCTATVRTRIGLAWASVTDPNGRMYLSDEFNHRIAIEGPHGDSSAFGSFGSGAGEFRFPRGLALVSGRTPKASRLFVADTWNHRVQVFDGNGAFQLAFGGFGHGDGQFNAPADIAIVSPQLPWETEGITMPMLVVADEWNQRLQVFTLDGVWLATLGGRTAQAELAPQGQGWPFFRIGSPAIPRNPVRLSWQAPWLTIVDGNGRTSRLDVAAAMLPAFEEWLATSTPAERAHASRYFRLQGDALRSVSSTVREAIATFAA
jgi:hypothetical protein